MATLFKLFTLFHLVHQGAAPSAPLLCTGKGRFSALARLSGLEALVLDLRRLERPLQVEERAARARIETPQS